LTDATGLPIAAVLENNFCKQVGLVPTMLRLYKFKKNSCDVFRDNDVAFLIKIHSRG